MGTHNKLCGAKHSPSAFSFCSGGGHSGFSASTPELAIWQLWAIWAQPTDRFEQLLVRDIHHLTRSFRNWTQCWNPSTAYLVTTWPFGQKRRHFSWKSGFLEIIEIIKESFEDHFLELLEAPGSSSTSLISRKSSDLTSTKKDDLTSPVTHFWHHFH